jgi:tetratricopeptide (TPR) repeat protein
MNENLTILLRFYVRPARAASDALDKGSLAFAVCLAGFAILLWSFGSPGSIPARALAAIFLVMVPLSVVIVTKWDGLGSASATLRREYVSILVCSLFAWAAAYLPFGLIQAALAPAGMALHPIIIAALAHFAFLALFCACLRTALGTSSLHAVAATLASWLGGLIFFIVWPIFGRFSYFLLSPWLLFVLYRYYSPDVRALGQVMSSRQNFRRQLEASMLNPRDADAHYQLGLIYQQRKQYDEAAASFLRAVAIQPDEADAHLQLGRVLRAQGKHEDALRHIELALQADSTVGTREGWRELGAVLLDLDRAGEAVAPLDRYTNHRSYDPEGLYYFATALRKTGRAEEARDAYNRTIEAVQTAPSYRRGQLRRWANDAKAQLRELR